MAPLVTQLCMGTDIRDMIQRCRDAGLPEPEIRIDSVVWGATIWRKPQQVTGEVTGEVTEVLQFLLVLDSFKRFVGNMVYAITNP